MAVGRGGAASVQCGRGSVGTARGLEVSAAPALVLSDVPSGAPTGLHTQLSNMHQLP